MSVKVIDTLKPKNNNTFPVVEAVDVAITSQQRLPEALESKANQSAFEELSLTVDEKADQAALNATNTTVALKANTADVELATDNLQAQINNIITPVTQDAEVQNARVGVDATNYTTLKERLDTEQNNQSEAINELKDTEPTKNMFDRYTMTDNMYIDEEGNVVTESDSESARLYITSDYIYCPSAKVTISSLGNVQTDFSYRIAIYDAEKTWLRRQLVTTDDYTLEGISGCYLRITFEKLRETEFNTVQVEVGANKTDYVPHYTAFDYNSRNRITYITPEMFGALGDGSPETAKIQAMFDWIADHANDFPIAVKGKTGATYKVGTINIATPTYNLAHNISIENCNFECATNLLFTGSSNNHYGFHFVNCNFKGYDADTTRLFQNYLFTYSSFEKCSFLNFKHVIYADVFEQLMTFDKCTFENCPYCFYGTAFYTLTVTNCTFKDCARILHQIMINELTQPYYRIAQKIYFENNYFNGYTDFAIKLLCYSSVDIIRNYFEHGNNSRHGVQIADSEDYTRGKYNLNVSYNHMQDTIDSTVSPRLVDASNATLTNLMMIGNVSYNTRFLGISGATVKGVIRYENNTHHNDNPTVQDILGDFTQYNFNGNINNDIYIKGRKIDFDASGAVVEVE